MLKTVNLQQAYRCPACEFGNLPRKVGGYWIHYRDPKNKIEFNFCGTEITKYLTDQHYMIRQVDFSSVIAQMKSIMQDRIRYGNRG